MLFQSLFFAWIDVPCMEAFFDKNGLPRYNGGILKGFLGNAGGRDHPIGATGLGPSC